MENLTVVYFFMDMEKAAKKRKRDSWEYHIEEGTLPKTKGKVSFYKIYLPRYYYKKKTWKKELWFDYMRGLQNVPSEGRGVYYILDEETQKSFNRGMEVLSFEWIIFLIELYQIQFDALVILWDREIETEQIIERFAKTTKYLGVVTNMVEDWEEYQDNLMEEYGFLLDVADSLKRLHIPENAKVLYITGQELYGTTPLSIQKNNTWLSTKMVDEEGKRLCARGKNIRFVSVEEIFFNPQSLTLPEKLSIIPTLI